MIQVSGGSPIISGNGIYAQQWYAFGNAFERYPNEATEMGISLIESNAVITDNTLSGFSVTAISLSGGSPLIQRNQISGQEGLLIGHGNPVVRNNTFSGCNRAIVDDSNSASDNLNIYYNNLESYPPPYYYNIYLETSSNLNATYNWWGTTDQSTISSTIYDFNKDFSLGTVTFTPFLIAPNSQATPNPNAPIPTPNTLPSLTSIPAQSASPTSSPTSAPSQTPITQPTPTPTPAVPEFSALAIVPLATALFSIAVVIKLRSKRATK